MQKPMGYDEAQAYTGEFTQLPPGGYICKIKNAIETTTKTGREAITLLVDIAEGEYKGFFQKQYNGNTKADKKWPNGGRYQQLTDGKSLEYFKGMITSIEKSNLGFVCFINDVLDVKKLTGKQIGCVFGREQYQKQNGDLAFATKVVQIRSIESIQKGVEPPEDKLLEIQTKGYSNDPLGQEVIFDDDDVPF